MDEDQPVDVAPVGGRLSVCMLAACPFPANHGTPGSIREMAEAISEQGHDVHIVTYHIGEEIPVSGPRIHRIPRLTAESAVVVGPTIRRPLYDLQLVFKALQVIRRHRCHLIHAHGYEAALVAWLCRMATGRPVVYSGHNTMADELASYRFIRPRWMADALAELLDRFVPWTADRCLPHSVNIEQFFHRMGLGGRTEPVVNFGIDLRQVAHGDGATVRLRHGLRDAPVVVYAGVMNEFQRLDLLLEAMVTVVRAEPRAKLLMVVTIPSAPHLADVRRRAAELGIAEHVILTDPQELGSVWEYLAACDVAVVPRPQAPGFPIKLLNYMAAGRACVLFASSASGLTDREDALLVAPDTGAALGAAILEVLRDRELRERLARNGSRFVRDHHDRRAIARRVVAAYDRTLALAGRPARGAGRPICTPNATLPPQPAGQMPAR